MIERWNRILAVVALGAPLLASCASSNPRDTNFDWNLERDPGTHRADAGTESRTRDHGDEDATQAAPQETAPPGWYNPQPQKGQVDVAPLPPPGPVSFVWPVKGRILSDFGTNLGGTRNDGINIAAALGTPIHAAANGVVSYAGNELKGYGNLILIRHADGYVTAYAHAERIQVNRGDAVSRGQVIGLAGETGDVSEPQLHFEIRHDTAPVNPRPLLVAYR